MSIVHEFYFWDLPVYRLTPELYQREIDNRANTNAMAIWGEHVPHASKQMQIAIEYQKQRFFERFGGWRYNEIIGYIRLHLVGQSLYGEYHSAINKRAVISRNRVFHHKTHKLAVQMRIHREASNAESFCIILQYVDACQRELGKKRQVDSAQLRLLGPHIDWLQLFKRRSEDTVE